MHVFVTARGGYAFTRVCLSTGGWWYPSMPCRWYPSMPCRSLGGGSPGPHWRGSLGPHPGGSPGPHLGGVSQHALRQPPPRRGQLLPRAVRILLECILVDFCVKLRRLINLKLRSKDYLFAVVGLRTTQAIRYILYISTVLFLNLIGNNEIQKYKYTVPESSFFSKRKNEFNF